jgi:hypothetical protein
VTGKPNILVVQADQLTCAMSRHLWQAAGPNATNRQDCGAGNLYLPTPIATALFVAPRALA